MTVNKDIKSAEFDTLSLQNYTISSLYTKINFCILAIITFDEDVFFVADSSIQRK